MKLHCYCIQVFSTDSKYFIFDFDRLQRKSSPGEWPCMNRVNEVENTPQRPCVSKVLEPYTNRLRLAKFLLPSALEREPSLIRNILFSPFPFPMHTFSTPHSSPTPTVGCLTPYPSFSVEFYYFRSRGKFSSHS